MKKLPSVIIIGILCLSMFGVLASKVDAEQSQPTVARPLKVAAKRSAGAYPALPARTGATVSTAAFTFPQYDEQFGLAFDGTFTCLCYDVCYIKMQDGAGIGPAYLLNGLTDKGYWYQVGVCYRWPTGFDTTESGFIYQVWDPNENSLSGSLGRATVLDFAGSVINGDVFTLTLSFQSGQVLMEAYDKNTGAYASATWDAYGATQFVGGMSPQFTGLMTEWYHTEEWVGNIPNGVPYWDNVGLTGSLTGGTMFIDEFKFTIIDFHLNKYTVFVNPQVDVTYTGNNLQFINYEGGTVYSRSDFLVTGPDKTDQVTFSYSVQGGGSPIAPFLAYTYGAQTHLITLSTTPQTYTVDDLTLWNSINSYQLGSERWVTKPDSGTAVSGTVNIVYYHQFLDTLSYSVSDGSGYDTPFIIASQFGQTCYQTLTTTATDYWFDDNTWSVSNPLISSTQGERWDTYQVVSGTLSSPMNEVFVYYHQYYLTMHFTYGSVSPGPYGGWWNAGSVVDISTTTPSAGSGEQYAWNGWLGTGDGSYSGMNLSATVTMNGPIIEASYWTLQYYLTLATSPPSVCTPDGQGWYDAGSSALISIYPYRNVAIVAGSSRYSFNGWTTSDMTEIKDPSSPVTTVIVDGAKTVTANYITQYNVTFSQTGVGSDFTGIVFTINGTNYSVYYFPLSFWCYNGSTSFTFAFQSPLLVGSGAKKYDWASTSGLSTLQSGSITVTGPGSVTGNYVTLVHDVAVTNITVYSMYDRTYVYQGMPVNITVTVWDNGDFPENVTVTLYYNLTANEIVGTQNMTLLAGENETLLFVWNTAGVAPCYTNYTLTAVATIPVDYTPADNTLPGGNITVRFMGDITGIGKVDMTDVGIAARAFGSHLGDSSWNPDADVNGDGKIDLRDIALIARNFGQHYP